MRGYLSRLLKPSEFDNYANQEWNEQSVRVKGYVWLSDCQCGLNRSMQHHLIGHVASVSYEILWRDEID
jgi:hypothetical protein